MTQRGPDGTGNAVLLRVSRPNLLSVDLEVAQPLTREFAFKRSTTARAATRRRPDPFEERHANEGRNHNAPAASDHLNVLDPQLTTFVRKSLGSIWALEVLLFVRRRAPDPVTVEAIDRELRATPYLVRRMVDHLVGEQLVQRELGDLVRFHARTPELERLCELLETASRERPIGLRDAIVGSHDTKLRTFADAFRFKDSAKDKGK